MIGGSPSRSFQRIGLFVLRQIGDVLLVTPALRALREHFPSAHIVAVVNDYTVPMLEQNPDTNEVWSYARSLRGGLWLTRVRHELGLMRKIRQARFDVTIDFTSGDRAAIYSGISGARIRIAYLPKRQILNWKKWAYTTYVERPPKLTHQTRRHLMMLEPLGVGVDVAPPLRLQLTDAERAWGAGQKPPGDGRVAVTHFTSNWLFKCWDDAKAAALIDWLQREKEFQVWFTCGPAQKEMEKARKILALCPTPPQSWIGNLTLRQLASLIAAADLFVGVDTAPMHLAAALGTPTVAIFGPTLAPVWSPWSDRAQVAQTECRCIAAEKVLCDRTKIRECLEMLSLATVQEAIANVLRERPPAKPVA